VGRHHPVYPRNSQLLQVTRCTSPREAFLRHALVPLLFARARQSRVGQLDPAPHSVSCAQRQDQGQEERRAAAVNRRHCDGTRVHLQWSVHVRF
jgi:hypothetical protein